jgi:CMP-N-acetylneuraminic acid synthetase
MKIYGVIPLRSGSKSIPMKNIKMIGGKPLAQWVIDSCNKSKYIHNTFIATDSDEIVDSLKNVNIFWRSKESSTDEAPTIMVIEEFCKDKEPNDIIVIAQATSPLTREQDIDRGIECVMKQGFDSCLSVVRQKRFIWSNEGFPLNYNPNKRPRRQDWDGYLVENGAFYICKVSGITEYKNFIYGKVGMVEMDINSYLELDEESDWEILNMLLSKKFNS